MARILRFVENRLADYLDPFLPAIKHVRSREYFCRYVRGQLSDVDRKNVEAIAGEAGVETRCLQGFLSKYVWDQDQVSEILHRIVAGRPDDGMRIGTIDETSDQKKGCKTPGVSRQHLGCLGKVDNGIVTVHLGYVNKDFHCMLGGDLYLPKNWIDDDQRRREAGIPEDITFRTKPEIALEIYKRAVDLGVVFDALTFDELYGRSVPFLRQLDQENQMFVGEVPVNFHVWLNLPPVTNRPYRKNGRGRNRKTPRLRSDASPTREVRTVLEDENETSSPWLRYHIKETQKGPMIWEVRHVPVWVKDESGLPMDRPWHLVVGRDVLNPKTVKYFISNAPANAPTECLLKVAFSRWRVERCFQDQKQEIGWDDYQGRRYLGLIRHMIISCVSYLFLATMKEELRESYPEITVCQVQEMTRKIFHARWNAYPLTAVLCEKVERELAYRENANARARKSHRRRRLKQLQEIGIDPEELPSCQSGESEWKDFLSL